ncbi:MAG: hypothetical protein RL685_3593 [Pseudomonadota bacterium]
MPKEEPAEILELEGREVRITHPGKLYFSQLSVTKLELARYFVAVAGGVGQGGALAGVAGRPIVLKRFVNGAEAAPFYQKRAPEKRPAWLQTVTLAFPSGRTAEEVVIDGVASLLWVVNLGCMELHPHPVLATDLEHPDELRVDLDPGPGVEFGDVRRVALEVRALLDELGLVGFPKTSGSRGLHINVPIEPRWGFGDVRRAALALAREVERRVPTLASAKWWKEERHGVFLDYNQNAKDRTTAAAYSVRPLPDARVSMPVSWAEVPDCEPGDFTVRSAPRRIVEHPDPHAGRASAARSLEPLLELAARDEAQGLGDAPWPPHFPRGEGEAPRVAPSRAHKPGRRSAMPLIVIAHSQDKAAALAGLERWKARHVSAAALLAADDVLVDAMRGRSSTWTRVRVNLRHVPEAERPPQETPDPDEDPTRAWREHTRQRREPKQD